ncbi:MAG: UvrD-helicase domain-containing protein [Planctomycetes bacterium]|nr:UvrD-helicase domain-containing protein [Planctomycetota bacterium]
MGRDSRIFDGLNEAQAEAVDILDGHLLVMAGAGSGKTRVITRRIARLIERGVPEETILAVTFTNKAAREMRDRVRQLVGDCRSTVCTFHAFGARFLRAIADRLGRPETFSLLDRKDSEAAVKKVLEKLKLDLNAHPPRATVEAIGGFKSNLQSTADALEAAISRHEEQQAQIYRAYEELLKEIGAFDFDDLLEKPVRLLESDPDLRADLNHCYGRVLVDEFQDVNLVQYRFSRLFGDRGLGGHGHLCVTGDPDQCIYTWRGADISYILGFQEEYPEARVVRLEQNYRSVNRILEAASAVIRFNPRHGDKRLWSERGEGDLIQIRRVSDEIEEARGVVRRIEELRARGARRSDIAVFYRLNSLSLPVERALIQANVPYQVWRGLEFFKRKEVKDALAWLKYLANPNDQIALLRIINTPTRGIGDKAIAALETQAKVRGTNPGRLLLDPKAMESLEPRRTRDALTQFSNLARAFSREAEGTNVARLLETILEESGYNELAAKQADRTGQDPRGNLDQLVSFARDHEKRMPEAGLVGFLEEISLLTDSDADDELASDKVALMTVHTAKGLEFPHVILIGADGDIFPHRRPQGDMDEEEERRLFYVALTRAQEDICLLTATQRTRFGRFSLSRPSIFLTEIPEDLTQVIDDTGGRPEDITSSTELRYDLEEDTALVGLAKGARVRHPEFGHGTVIRLGGRGDGARAEVQFDEAGRKRLLLAYARLEVIEGGEAF